jgi:hypothetical protein
VLAVSGISNPASSGASNQITETLINTTNSPINVTYTFSISPSGCNGTASVQQNIITTVNPSGITPVVGSYSICQNSTVPSGEGITMPNVGGGSSVSDVLTVNSPVYRSTYYYKQYSFVAPSSGSVTFEITEGTFDSYLYIYSSFDPNSPNANMIAADDDSGEGVFSKITMNVAQGTTYVIVVSTYYSGSTGSFTLNTSLGVLGDTPYAWFSTPTGGTSLFSGLIFNPVGVAGSGIPNTRTPIVKNYFVARSNNLNCRTSTTFTVHPAEVSSILSGMVIPKSDTLCSIFNQGTLQLQGHTGNVLNWEVSNDNFQTVTNIPNNTTSYNFSGLTGTIKVRGILDQGICRVGRSNPSTLYVSEPVHTLTAPVMLDTNLSKASLRIISSQVIHNASKVHYMAGQNIDLNPGFESKEGSNLQAEIFDNDCYIPAMLSLRPNSTQSKDADISSLLVNSNFATNPYLVPFAWNQFGNTEIRRTLIQFDLSSLPASAVIDSAFFSLHFSQKFVEDNPPFTGHFGANTMQIKRITQPWNASTVTWANQPPSTNTNLIELPSATAQTQNYLKINVKNLITDMTTEGNNGFLIQLKTETPFKISCLNSSEESNEALRPSLIIYYRYL